MFGRYPSNHRSASSSAAAHGHGHWPSSASATGHGAPPYRPSAAATGGGAFGLRPSPFSLNNTSSSSSSTSANSAPSYHGPPTPGFQNSTPTTPNLRSNSNIVPPSFPQWSYYAPPLHPYSLSNWDNKNNRLKEDAKEDLKRQISFLNGYLVVFKEQNPTDLHLKPNDGQPSIPAHRAVLASRSKICKSEAQAAETVSLPELNTEELESLLEFLYTGNMPSDKLNKHVYSLYFAAVKYEIEYLQWLCERHLINSLAESNAVHILEFADAHSNTTLKEAAINFIVGRMGVITSTNDFQDFASRNPHLCAQINSAFAKKFLPKFDSYGGSSTWSAPGAFSFC